MAIVILKRWRDASHRLWVEMTSRSIRSGRAMPALPAFRTKRAGQSLFPEIGMVCPGREFFADFENLPSPPPACSPDAAPRRDAALGPPHSFPAQKPGRALS